MKQEVIAYLLGPGEPSYFIAAIIYSLVGVLISLLISSAKRDQSNPTTPDNFSWSYLLWDNAKRILLSFLLIVVTLRFSRELIGADITMYLAFLIGLAYDRLADHWKSKGLFDKKIPTQND